jgi:transmembrane sensor
VPETATDQDAAYWAVRLATAGDDPLVRAGAHAWVAAEPQRRGQLLRAQAVLQLAAGMAMPSAAEPGAPAQASPTAAMPWLGRRRLLAGSGLMAAGMAFGLVTWNGRGAVATSVGEIRQLPLEDGSTLALNSASRVLVRFSPDERRLLLDAGEVLFRVTRAPNRPFMVIAGEVMVIALGTILAVRREASRVTVLVTEGVVEVRQAAHAPVRLAAGQEGAFWLAEPNAQPRPQVRNLTSAEAGRRLAWRDGRLEFAGETVDEAIAMANRYTTAPIRLADPALGRTPVHGVFRINDVPGLARTLAAMLDTPLQVEADALVIGTPAPPPAH